MGHIDILINNAGIIRRQDLLEFGNKDWDDVININQKPCSSCRKPWRNSL